MQNNEYGLSKVNNLSVLRSNNDLCDLNCFFQKVILFDNMELTDKICLQHANFTALYLLIVIVRTAIVTKT